MPIDVKELVQAQRPLEERILEFLAANPDKAYSAYEVQAGVDRLDANMLRMLIALSQPAERDKILARTTATLEKLLNANKVIKGEHHGQAYYAIKQP